MRRTSLVIAVFVAVYGASGPSSVQAQPGMTYESLKDLPDFAGSWTPLTPPFVLAPAVARPQGGTGARPPSDPCAFPPQFKAEVASRCRAAREQGAGNDPCARRTVFGGRPPEGAGGAFEILFTPGRITMAVEIGLVRRIYLRAEPPSGALDVSRSGTSIGRWEGTTLVVETTGLDPSAPLVPGSTVGRNAHVEERIALVDADTLQIEATLTAPDVLASPLTRRQRYRRAPDRVFTDFEVCVEGDRSFDRATGQDRFDKTPPSDLPPPPTE